MSKRKNYSGFTLVESLVVCSIVSVLMGLAVPSFSQMLSNFRVKNDADVFFRSVALTRSEAITRNSRAVMCKSADGRSCTQTGGWDQGWLIFHDANSNAELDVGEALVWYQNPLESHIQITGNGPVAKYVSYTGSGNTSLVSGALQMGTLTFCKPSPRVSHAWQVVISSTGRPRNVKTTVKQCV